MPEITALKPVSLREAWPREERDFTPWLADNIDLLGAMFGPETGRCAGRGDAARRRSG